MSAIQEIEKELRGAKSEQLRKALLLIKAQLRAKGQALKEKRRIIDQRARAIFKTHYRANADAKHPHGQWDSKKAQREFQRLMQDRHMLHFRIARIVPEKVEPEWDSP